MRSTWNACSACSPRRFEDIDAARRAARVPDHATLFPALIGKLEPGGTLAVQVPDNADEPAHRLIREIAADGPWAGKFGAATRLHRNEPLWYFGALREKTTRLDIWRTTYFHVLQGGSSAVVEWFKGSALRPYLEAL